MSSADRRKAPIVYVMGPSGAGKDSVLRYARERIGSHPIAFAHRYITRPPVAGDENHVALLVPEFALRQSKGLFAMSWEAHGLRYGIGVEVEAWREAGLCVVVNGSRAHFQEKLTAAPDILPVVIKADPQIIAARLASRGRERVDAVKERVERGNALDVAHPTLVTIDNSGPLERAGDCFIELLIAAAAGIS